MSHLPAILHVDMDAFYASIEILENPDLQGKPVIVGGAPELRGAVASASYEARKFGVRSAMSSYRARGLCPQAVFIAPRMNRYVAYSRRIFAIFDEYTPLVEPVSIDEAFLDVTGSRRLFGPAPEIGRTIQGRIRNEVGLGASVGVGPNKFLAKLASDLEKPNGFVVIEAGEAPGLLAGLPVRRLWGVGPVTEKALAEHGICKVKDILKCPPDELVAVAGSSARTLIDLARGIDERPVVPDERSKSIGAETTFAKDIADADVLGSFADALTARVAKRLRRDGYRAHTVHLKARYPNFKTLIRSTTLATPTASTRTLQKSARDLFQKRLDRRGRPLRLIGVSVSNLVRPDEGPTELFGDGSDERLERMDHLLDELQEKFGSKTIWRGEKNPLAE